MKMGEDHLNPVMTVSDLNVQVRQYDMGEIPEKGNKDDINGGVKGKNKE
jgi:hypothetical protein